MSPVSLLLRIPIKKLLLQGRLPHFRRSLPARKGKEKFSFPFPPHPCESEAAQAFENKKHKKKHTLVYYLSRINFIPCLDFRGPELCYI